MAVQPKTATPKEPTATSSMHGGGHTMHHCCHLSITLILAGDIMFCVITPLWGQFWTIRNPTHSTPCKVSQEFLQNGDDPYTSYPTC